jgi:transcriptional regulator with XRE-family HTH domain
MVTYVWELIRERRRQRGLTQADLADLMGVARNTVNRWETGQNQPTNEAPTHFRKRLAKELGGQAEDYEWSSVDYDRSDKLARIKLEAAAYTRQLMSEV